MLDIEEKKCQRQGKGEKKGETERDRNRDKDSERRVDSTVNKVYS
jgi:hypothetical protein